MLVEAWVAILVLVCAATSLTSPTTASASASRFASFGSPTPLIVGSIRIVGSSARGGDGGIFRRGEKNRVGGGSGGHRRLLSFSGFFQNNSRSCFIKRRERIHSFNVGSNVVVVLIEVDNKLKHETMVFNRRTNIS